MTGWMLVPSVASLGLGAACTVHAVAPDVADLAFAMLTIVGCLTSMQMVLLHLTTSRARAALRAKKALDTI
jgi:hypothetical protein